MLVDSQTGKQTDRQTDRQTDIGLPKHTLIAILHCVTGGRVIN